LAQAILAEAILAVTQAILWRAAAVCSAISNP